MSNHVNDVFMDVMEVLNHLIYKRPAYEINTPTSRNLAHITIDCSPNLANTPFIDVEVGGYWNLEIKAHPLESKASSLHWAYSNQGGGFHLYGIAGNGRLMKSHSVYDDGKPLENYYPQLRTIINGKYPSGFAFFAVSLASTLSQEVTGIGISAKEFVTKWQEAIATKDVKALDSLTYQF